MAESASGKFGDGGKPPHLLVNLPAPVARWVEESSNVPVAKDNRSGDRRRSLEGLLTAGRRIIAWQPPTRRVIVECRGVVRQYRVTAAPQRAAAGIVLLVAAWIGHTTYATLARDSILDTARGELMQVKSDYLGLQEQLAQERSRSSELADAGNRAERAAAELAALQTKLAETEKEVARISTERDQAAALQTTLVSKVDAYQSLQLAIASRLEEPLRKDMKALEDSVTRVGLSARELLGRQNQGGPLVPIATIEAMAAHNGGGDCKAEVASALTVDAVDRREKLRQLVAALPLGRPIGVAEVTSGFGRRIDPINGQLAMHTGMDFRNAVGTAVTATAPGEVVQAGWGGEYGRQVEVRHAGGLVTRYAHLESVAVKVGDTIKAGAIIGRLGNSGRSTGPHLHYEVLVDGVARNPEPFVQGRGKNVQQAPRTGS
jgi:murein DD-endopeptidase MepM/ murein hydrolase activator NlpD